MFPFPGRMVSAVSWFSSLVKFFRAPDAARLVRDGQVLHWKPADLPVNVWVDGGEQSRAAVLSAVRYMRGLGAPLMFPEALEPATRNMFFASRETFQGAIVVQPYVTTEGPGAFRCTSDLRYDKRTGEMRNVLIEWNVSPGDYASNVKRLIHEFGHCLGLAHEPGTIMQDRVSNWGEVAGFSAAQLRYIKSMRGST